MAESKKITVVRMGGSASIGLDVTAGQTAQQVCVIAAPKLGLPEGGTFRLLTKDETEISPDADIFAAVQDGDTVQLAHVGTGGKN